MYRYTIVKHGNRLDSYLAESLEALEFVIAFKNRIEANTWGRREPIIEQVLVKEAYSEEVLVTEATESEPAQYKTVHHEAEYTELIHPAQFEIIEEDISVELEVADKIQQINLLESQVTSRRYREAILTGDYSFIESIEDQIQAIRDTL